MGGAFSGRGNGSEGAEDGITAYKYPPKSGNYFERYFFLGGSLFPMIEPETFLFGDSNDLNFLGCQLNQYPYEIAYGSEPTRALRALINIRKDSVRLVRNSQRVDAVDAGSSNQNGASNKNVSSANSLYNLEFTFDSEVSCSITIYYGAHEEYRDNELHYTADGELRSETFRYERGLNQRFLQPSHLLDPNRINVPLDLSNDVYPIVIHIVADSQTYAGHSHATVCAIERSEASVAPENTSEGSSNASVNCSIKVVKQKQVIDGLVYVLNEIYGIENKISKQIEAVRNGEPVNMDFDSSRGEPGHDTGVECVVCMSEPRDTLILPCRHLCLCAGCAENLRAQAANCPMCRAPFRALLQIQALRRRAPRGCSRMLTPSILVNVDMDRNPADNEVRSDGTGPQNDASCSANVPAGYEVVSLVEALNGLTCATSQNRDSLARRSRSTAGNTAGAGHSRLAAGSLRPHSHSHGLNLAAEGSNAGIPAQSDLSRLNNMNDDEEEDEEDDVATPMNIIRSNLDTLPKKSVHMQLSVDNENNESDTYNYHDNDNESVTTECSELASIAANFSREQAGPSVSVVYVQKPKPATAAGLKAEPSSSAGWQSGPGPRFGHNMRGPASNAAPNPGSSYRAATGGYPHYPQPQAATGPAGPPPQRSHFSASSAVPESPEADFACHVPIVPAAHVHHAHQITTTCFSTSTVQHGHNVGMGAAAVSHTRTTTMSVCCVAPPVGAGVVQHAAVAVQHTSIVEHFEAAYPVPVTVPVGVAMAHQPDDAQMRARGRHSMDVGAFVNDPRAGHGHGHGHGHGNGHGHGHRHQGRSAASAQQARMTRSMHETRHERIHEESDEDNENESMEMRQFGSNSVSRSNSLEQDESP